MNVRSGNPNETDKKKIILLYRRHQPLIPLSYRFVPNSPNFLYQDKSQRFMLNRVSGAKIIIILFQRLILFNKNLLYP
jgi:hypothetical protein